MNKQIRKTKNIKSKIIALGSIAGIVIIILLLVLLYMQDPVPSGYVNENTPDVQGGNKSEIEDEDLEQKKEDEVLRVNINISEHYITNIGNASNLYYIDDQGVLWGSGENQFGQLGQGTKDQEFYEDMVKIAEDVVHVDYSQKGFVIYLTETNELYGMGNGGTGALQQFPTYSGGQYGHDRPYDVTEPVLLLSDTVYARCGRDDIAAIKSDSSVWVWGVLWQQGMDYFDYVASPKKVLEHAELVTGGFFNHAALLEDGSVWTWGYNLAGSCGVKEPSLISEPQKAADHTTMVWTGSIEQNIDCFDIRELDGIERQMENTIIQKDDGTYWICGINVGEEEKTIAPYYEMWEYTVIYTHEFHPYDFQ